LTVADADGEPRFYPLVSKDVALTLADNVVKATASLQSPDNGARITNVSLEHDLGQGRGHADLDVPGVRFGPSFQPDKLTRFTYGVIADVEGTVSGAGHLRWTPEGTTSDGVFRTDNLQLAAAFGPVAGLAGEVRFTDLLNLASAPGQVATVGSINPGIPVLGGMVRYRLLPGSQVAVERAEWPFAGGTLILEPTILDFSTPTARRLTFRVIGVNAAQFLQQLDFKNLDATGTFDGVLPMIFDAQGGRIEDGHLAVRESGGTIAYVGELSQKDLGFWGNMAFQALKSLRYKNVDIAMNGPLEGEMITEVRFAGVSQGAGTKSNFLIRRLQKLPLVFNVRIAAPFRQLLDSVQSYYDPRRLIERQRAALLEGESDDAAPPPKPSPAVQPPASEPMP
ncbi:MAG: YdbH domain-containing protein, partial [Sphingomonas sp.]|nr:YdbH domain-containing protein [Sphingomonas sp.]